MPPSEGEVRRLALIRYLYRQGARQADDAEPLASFAILYFHDAVEWFLGLVCDRFDIDPPYSLMEHWEKIRTESGGEVELGHKSPMRSLNRARRQLKHEGTFIASSSVEDFRSATEAFLTEEVRAVFGASFDSLSLVELVPSESVRERLSEARSLAGEGECKRALEEVAIGFKQARQEIGENPFVGIDSSRPWGSDFGALLRDPGFRQFCRSLYGELDTIEEILRLLALDVDLPRYIRFRTVTPRVSQTRDGEYRVTWIASSGAGASVEQVEFCVDFVIEAALRFASTESSSMDRPWGQRLGRGIR